MKKLVFTFILILLTGCLSKDIANWDINIKKVDKVELFALNNQQKTVEIEKEDAIQLINTFNNVKSTDIIEENSTGLMYFMYPGSIFVISEDETITISFFQTGLIKYNNTEYYLELDSEIFDLIRELEVKYDMGFSNWEIDLSYDNYLSDGGSSWWITTSSTSINKTYMKFDKETEVDRSFTFNDLLKDKEYKLNDVIETDDMKIIVLHTINGEVDIIGFKFK